MGSGYLIRIGNYIVPSNMISAGSYFSNGFSAFFTTPAMMASDEYKELIENIMGNLKNGRGEITFFDSCGGTMRKSDAEFVEPTPKVYSTYGGVTRYYPVLFEFKYEDNHCGLDFEKLKSVIKEAISEELLERKRADWAIYPDNETPV